MARTVLRNRPEDAGDLAELLDRTGILAASIPRQRRRDDAADDEHLELVVPSRGVGRSAVLGWVAGALMLVVAFGGMYGFGQREEPVESAGGLTEQTTVSAPEAQAPIQPAPAQPQPVMPEPESEPVRTATAAKPEPEPDTKQPQWARPEPLSTPEARVDLPEQATEPKPVTKVRKQVRSVVEPAFEAADSMIEMIPGFAPQR
ncbi:hypothetical protein SAMN05216266_103280 [Amycolatopsis marina]|uniref:Uncharacterized protein n=1 Tax=Amycolatopsis marina TaxID=490629 RepID=A0A1I0XJQ8_9PSEU|nr:hypothetical protein [Amycolatopsis marina]SFB01349.1 hypothetical protein SAMN05216266_103280 [Amycolatopsis marina]